MTTKEWIDLEDRIMIGPDAAGHFARLLVAGGWLWLARMHQRDKLRKDCLANASGILAGIENELAAAWQAAGGRLDAADKNLSERVSKSRKGECGANGTV